MVIPQDLSFHLFFLCFSRRLGVAFDCSCGAMFTCVREIKYIRLAIINQINDLQYAIELES